MDVQEQNQALIAEQKSANALSGREGQSVQTRVNLKIDNLYQETVLQNPETQAQLDAMSPLERAQHRVDWQQAQGFQPTSAAMRDLESLQYVEANPKPVQSEPVQPEQNKPAVERASDAEVLEYAQFQVEDAQRFLDEQRAAKAEIEGKFSDPEIIAAAQERIDSAQYFLDQAKRELENLIEQQTPEVAQSEPAQPERNIMTYPNELRGMSIAQLASEQENSDQLSRGMQVVLEQEINTRYKDFYNSENRYDLRAVESLQLYVDWMNDNGFTADEFTLQQLDEAIKREQARLEDEANLSPAGVIPDDPAFVNRIEEIKHKQREQVPAKPEREIPPAGLIPMPDEDIANILDNKNDAINGAGNQVMPKTDDTMAIQQALVDAGYDIGHNADGTPMVDGLEGPLTRAAIEDYAQDQGLDLNEMTADELIAAIENTVQTQQIVKQIDMGGADVILGGDPGFIQENVASIGVPIPEPQPLSPGIAPQQRQMGTPGQMA